MAPEQMQYYFQLSNLQQQPQQQQQQQQSNAASTSQQPAAATPQIAGLPAGAQIIQQANGQIIIAAQPHQIAQLTGAAGGGVSL